MKPRDPTATNPLNRKGHVHNDPKRAVLRAKSIDIEHCPRCGEPLPEQSGMSLCQCPWCGARICEGVV